MDVISTEANLNFTKEVNQKKIDFDSILRTKWKRAQEKGLFRYVLNIQDSKILCGTYKFLIQLNVNRGCNRRLPENITSMQQPFNEDQFNFTKLPVAEEIMNLNSIHEGDVIVINASPFEYCHSLLLPQKHKNLPQIITKHSLHKALQLFSLSSSSHLRMAFNSLCGYASVNHLHWHLYYLNWTMLLEYINLQEYAGPIEILEDYPAKGFCIRLSNVRDIDDFVDWAYLLINYLQNAQIAHNVYITRARLMSEGDYKDLRIYVWGRKHEIGVKDTTAFNPAACELFGHITVKSEAIYKNITEEHVTNILKDTTEGSFFRVFADIKHLIMLKTRMANA